MSIGGLNPDYPGDQWHFALSLMIVACRAYGLRPIDGPFSDYSDPDGFRASARRAAALGCEGKWAIHPSQVELANEVFSPPEAEVDRARRIIEALRQAEAQGKGEASACTKIQDSSLRLLSTAASDQLSTRSGTARRERRRGCKAKGAATIDGKMRGHTVLFEFVQNAGTGALLLGLMLLFVMLVLGMIIVIRARKEDLPEVVHGLAEWFRSRK